MGRGISNLVPATRTARTSRPVRIFSADPAYGQHKFTARDLQTVVANFDRYQRGKSVGWPHPQAVGVPAFDPAVIEIGHDPDQLVAKAILSRTDLPSIGEPSRVWMQGPDLYAEFDNVPEELAAMMNAGAFKHVSATIYPNYRTPDGQYHGPTLRGVSLLGYTQPVLKGMGRIPPMVFSEPARGRPAQQYVAVFSELSPMDETQARSILEKCFPNTPLDGIPPAFLIMMAEKLAELSPSLAGSGDTPPAAPEAPPPMTPEGFSERFLGPAIDRRLAAAVQPIVQQMAQFQATIGAQVKDQERQTVVAFSERNRDRLYPFELDPKDERYIVSRLLNIPANFRQAEMKAIESRPKSLAFSETAHGMPDPIMSDNPAAAGHGKIVGGESPTITTQRRAELLALSKTGRQLRLTAKPGGN